MDKNIQSIIGESERSGKQEVGEANSPQVARFFQQFQQFLSLAAQSSVLRLKHFRQCSKISLLKPREALQSLNAIASEVYGTTFQQLQSQLHRLGLRITHKKTKGGETAKIVIRSHDNFPFLSNLASSIAEDDSSSVQSQQQQMDDDFPKSEEMEHIMRLKEEKIKGSAKPNVILSKAHSEGMLGIFDKKRTLEDNSLQFKLYEQDLFSTPAVNRKHGSQRHSEEQNGHSLTERNNAYKENYEKCSKLIDNAMIEILSAHRSKKIGEKADQLLGKIVEIYDILSDNIENVSTTVREMETREPKKQNQVSSPGFKPLNGLNNDSMK